MLDDIAWIIAENKTYFATAVPAGGDSPQHASAVCRLVAGIYDHEGFGSLKVLRQRIFATGKRNDFDGALIKLAAKRCTFEARFDERRSFWQASDAACIDLSSATIGDITADRTNHLGGKGVALSHSESIQAVRDLANSVPLEPERFASPRPIAALVVDKEGELLAAAVNNNTVNRLRHAEFNLVFNHFIDKQIPAGATVFSTLSPCRMCAALLAKVAVDGGKLRVLALAQDPGRYGQQRSLQVQVI